MKSEVPDVSLLILEASSAVLCTVTLTSNCNRLKSIFLNITSYFIYFRNILILQMHNAELYVQSNHLQYKEAKNFLHLCSSKGYMSFKDRERVLDIGCGPGDVTNRLLLPLLAPDSKVVKKITYMIVLMTVWQHCSVVIYIFIVCCG